MSSSPWWIRWGMWHGDMAYQIKKEPSGCFWESYFSLTKRNGGLDVNFWPPKLKEGREGGRKEGRKEGRRRQEGKKQKRHTGLSCFWTQLWVDNWSEAVNFQLGKEQPEDKVNAKEGREKKGENLGILNVMMCLWLTNPKNCCLFMR